MICQTVTNPGFLGILYGFWDGLTAIFKLVLSIFWDFQVYNTCSYGWWYNLGFMLGIAGAVALGLQSVGFFLALFVIVLIVFLISLFFGQLAWVVGVILVAVLIYIVYRQSSATQ